MRIPEIQKNLRACAEELRRISKLVDDLTAELDRRKWVARAKPTSRPMTPILAGKARRMAAFMSQHEIAAKLRVNPGRVSEAIHGKRT